MKNEPSFADKLAVLVSFEATKADKDLDLYGVMIERISAALGFTIALAARGDPKGIDEFMIGAEKYAHAEAVEKAPLARFMAEVRRNAKGSTP